MKFKEAGKESVLEKKSTEHPKEVVIESEELHFDSQEFDRMLERVSSKGSEGGKPKELRRRMVYIPIFPEQCLPDTFLKPIKVGMMELDSQTELQVLSSLPNPDKDEDQNFQAFGMALAKASIHSVNGRNLSKHEKGLLWEVIGFGGRSALGVAFIQHIAGIGVDFLERSLNSVEVV